MVYKMDENYLSHHGIKGQKWGEQNGPPYPLEDEVKAIAYKGGVMPDGKRINNITDKDVKKARRRLAKRKFKMSETDTKEYEDRLKLEYETRELLGMNDLDHLGSKISNSARKACIDSIKNTGDKLVKNIQVELVRKVISNSVSSDFGDLVADILMKQK